MNMFTDIEGLLVPSILVLIMFAGCLYTFSDKIIEIIKEKLKRLNGGI